ncbi:MAG: mannose-6-phosphate isomerase, class I [Chitinivibrionia bacterium]|nr:mannose-6-phosphate isomerase, class I [Chitinivibrionia bacterium]
MKIGLVNDFYFLRNPVQEYAWGSRTAIAELLGAPSPSETPQAELWMGAHPKAPSEVLIDHEWHPLPALLEHSPAEVLGRRTADMFGGSLPFLFKVLAAERPLSIQAHPDRAQARAGFERENEIGIPLDAPNRNYKDANHKPETICALTPFRALSGFRPPESAIEFLEAIGPSELSKELGAFKRSPDAAGLKRFFTEIMTMDGGRKSRAVAQAVEFARGHAGDDPAFECMLELDAHYRGDIGILSPLLLNLVNLQPGQAMFLGAGSLHAYLGGVGIELMANSDNVLRGGLTPKHIDVPELLAILHFDEQPPAILEPVERAACERVYETRTGEFELSVITVSRGVEYTSADHRSVEILLCTGGKALALNARSGRVVALSKGMSVLVPAAMSRYAITGDAAFYKASVPQ